MFVSRRKLPHVHQATKSGGEDLNWCFAAILLNHRLCIAPNQVLGDKHLLSLSFRVFHF